jgi:hypothetical protein
MGKEGATGHKIQYGKKQWVYQFRRDTKCSSFWTDWGRPGETYGRTRPGTLISQLIDSVDGHSSGGRAAGAQFVNHPRQKSTFDDSDRWGLCTNSGGSHDSRFNNLYKSGGEPTMEISDCRDVPIAGTNIEKCMADGDVKTTPDGSRNLRMRKGLECTGPEVGKSITSLGLFGAYVLYKGAGTIANSRSSNGEYHWDGTCFETVNGLANAKARCAQLGKCGGFMRKSGTNDAWCINNGWPHSYPGYEKTPARLGHNAALPGFSPAAHAYDVYLRQAYTPLDIVEMCESTAGCDCVDMRYKQDQGEPNRGRKAEYSYTWSMHKTSDARRSGDDSTYAIFAQNEASTAGKFVGHTGLSMTCTADSAQKSASFVADNGQGSLDCIAGCTGYGDVGSY